MQLTGRQIAAMASQFVREYNEAYRKEDEKRDEAARKKFDASADGKVYATLPGWMKERISGYTLNERVAKYRLNTPMPRRINENEVQDRIVIASIGKDSVEQIMAELKKHFK